MYIKSQIRHLHLSGLSNSFAWPKGQRLSQTSTMTTQRCTIQEALEGRQIFLTGATGMLGTALVSKLVNDTEISTLHVLVRGGPGKYT